MIPIFLTLLLVISDARAADNPPNALTATIMTKLPGSILDPACDLMCQSNTYEYRDGKFVCAKDLKPVRGSDD